jgi:hypothetical protein
MVAVLSLSPNWQESPFAPTALGRRKLATGEEEIGKRRRSRVSRRWMGTRNLQLSPRTFPRGLHGLWSSARVELERGGALRRPRLRPPRRLPPGPLPRRLRGHHSHQHYSSEAGAWSEPAIVLRQPLRAGAQHTRSTSSATTLVRPLESSSTMWPGPPGKSR